MDLVLNRREPNQGIKARRNRVQIGLVLPKSNRARAKNRAVSSQKYGGTGDQARGADSDCRDDGGLRSLRGARSNNQRADGHSGGQQLESFKAAKGGELHVSSVGAALHPAIVGGNNLWPNWRLDETTCPCFSKRASPGIILRIMMKSLVAHQPERDVAAQRVARIGQFKIAHGSALLGNRAELVDDRSSAASSPATFCSSIDDFISSVDHCFRNSKPQRGSGPSVDRECVIFCVLNGEIAGPCAPHNFIDVDG
jgi:hypothetical protein